MSTITSKFSEKYQGGRKMYHVKRHDETKMKMVEHPHVAQCMKGHEKDMCDPPKSGQAKVGVVMREFKHGTLHSGSKKGPKVKSRKQAIAIAMSEAGLSRKRR